MRLRNDSEHWGAVSIGLHWLILGLILGLGTVGLLMDELPRSPKYFWVYTLHKSVGLTVLGLVLLRMLWRLAAGAPGPVPGTPRWQHALASLTHGLLYVLVLAIPLSGWLYDSAASLRPFRYFGQWPVPKLSAPNEALEELAHAAHGWLFWTLMVVALAHAAAALYHHYVRRDATLVRMLPRRWRPQSPPAKESHDVA